MNKSGWRVWAALFGCHLTLSAAGAAPSASAPATTSVRPAPPFSLTDDRGIEHRLPSGQEGVDIYLFWATWCPYCKALMPHLQSIRDEYGGKVRVYALDIRDEDGDPRAVLDAQGYDFILLPKADAVSERYGVLATPGLYLVDRAGDIRFSLYDLIAHDDPAFQAMNNNRKAARRAPWWAAEIRRTIDRLLTAVSASPAVSSGAESGAEQ